MARVFSTTSEFHFKFLREFAEFEIAAGGPDPHMRICGWLSQDAEQVERTWLAGLYVGFYNAPTAEVVWNEWPWARVKQQGPPSGAWLAEHWRGLSFRRERRAVRTVVKMTRYLKDYADWMESRIEGKAFTSYEELWESVGDIYGLGRYAAFKLLEFFWRYCDSPWKLPDIRPSGGWSPRMTLALLYPEHEEALNGGDKAANIKVVNSVAADAINSLSDIFHDDYYIFEVMLCDYRQSFEGKRQYPGRSQDSELEYYAKITPHWPSFKSRMFEARKSLFPPQVLGELQGWAGVRKELGKVLSEHGYTWSDFRYDYLQSQDLSRPVKR